jgi:hypothetical protein
MKRLLYFVHYSLLVCLVLPAGVMAKETQTENKKELINIGGQVRFRYDATFNQSLEDFSYTPGTKETQLLNRTRVHVEANPKDWVRVYFEPQFYGRWGGYNNEDRLSVYQGYIEFLQPGKLPADVRLGRQDFVYGAAFFLGNDDWYRGLTWDGAKIHIQPTSTWFIDLLAVRLVSFTNNKADEPSLYGFYATYSGIRNTDWDFYFFYNRHGFAHLNEDIPNSPLWFTAGTRLAARLWERLHFEVEPIYQFGKVRYNDRGDDAQIRAYGGHIDLRYDFKLPFEPSLMISYVFGTGDSNNNDNTYREFQGSMYNDSLLFGDMSVIPDASGVTIRDVRASGLKDITVASIIKPCENLTVNLDYHYFQAAKIPKGFTRTLGSEIDLYLQYEVSEKINLCVGANRFFTADIFRQATGSKKDVDYFYLQTQIEF